MVADRRPARLERLEPRALSRRIVDQLKRVIIAGELRPGDRVLETDLAEQLGVSRGPVREAFRQLEQEGLLVSFPHRGTFVATIPEDEIEEVYATGAVRVDPAIGEAGDLDTAVVVLRHADGVLTTIDNSREAVYGYDQRVEAFGSGGMVGSENALTTTTILRNASGGQQSTLPDFFRERYEMSYLAEWEDFARMRLSQGGDLRKYYPLSAEAVPEYEEWKKSQGQ